MLETLKSESQRRKWIFRIKRKDFVPTGNSQICSLHFKDEDFVPEEKNVDSRGRKHKRKNLKPNVVPSLLMGYDISGTYFTKDLLIIMKTCIWIFLWNRTYSIDVSWGQPIKLIQVVSTSEFHEYWWNDVVFFCPFHFLQGLM